jgi:hypothetical protein
MSSSLFATLRENFRAKNSLCGLQAKKYQRCCDDRSVRKRGNSLALSLRENRDTHTQTKAD